MQSGTDQPETFEDPALKAALERVWGRAQAPRVLHERLAQAILAAHAPAPRVMRTWARRPLFGLAAAALVLVAVGATAYHFLSSSQSPAANAVLTSAVARDLVATHDQCCAQPDHHMPGLSRDDFPAIARELQSRLGLVVLASPVREVGWRFNGASVCPVGNIRSAHLVFKRGGENLSVFSLPAAVISPGAANGAESSVLETGHPIAAFIAGKGMYALVGSSPDGSLTLDRIRSFRDEFRPALSASAVSPASPSALLLVQ